MRLCHFVAGLLITLAPGSAAAVPKTVSSAAELSAALEAAQPGDTIRLLPQTSFMGHFVITRSGRLDAPIYILGTETSVLDGDNTASGDTIHLQGVDYVVLDGFVVQHGRTGIALDHSKYNRIYGVTVRDTGAEGIVVHGESSGNTIENSTILNTGRDSKSDGRGIEVGSPISNWCVTSGCKPDLCKGNVVQTNHVGPGVTAQSIVVREGSNGTLVNSNALIGDDIAGEGGAHAFLDIAGSKTSVLYNEAELTKENHEITNGFVIRAVSLETGDDSVLRGNHIRMKGYSGNGYGLQLTNVFRTKVCETNEVEDAPLSTQRAVNCEDFR